MIEALKKPQEFISIVEENHRRTLELMEQHDIPLPFPEFENTQIMQPIKNQWDKLHRCWYVKKGAAKGLRAIASVATYGDEVWYHVSFSRSSAMPSYRDVSWVRTVFFSPDLKAIQVFPKKKKHVNFHPFTLHLWANLQRDPLPDFDVMGMV